MRKAAIYPITSHNQFLLRELDGIFEDLNITTIVVPNAFAQEVSAPNYTVFHRVEDLVGSVDAVIFISSWDTQRMHNEISMILSHGIDVITTIAFSMDAANQLHQVAKLHGAEFRMPVKDHIIKLLNERDDVYSQPESIVIAVSSITKGISTSEMITSISASLKSIGYNVGVICSDADLQLIRGYEWLPINNMITDHLDRCIMKINSFANLLQMIQKPDVILVQMPDEGLYRMTYDFASCFGAKTYLISQAIDFDYGIVLSPLIDSDPSLYEQLSEISKSRFGFEYNSVCVCPKIVNVDIAQGEETVKYYTAPSDNLAKTVEELKNCSTNEISYFSASGDFVAPLVQRVIDYLS